MAWRGPRGRSCDLLPRMQKLSWLHRREVDLTIPPLWSPPVPSVSWPNSKSGREPFDQVQTGQASRTQSWWWAGSGSLGLHWRQRVHYVEKVILQCCEGMLRAASDQHPHIHTHLLSTQHHLGELDDFRYCGKHIIYFIFSFHFHNYASN